jgi:sulfur carrier protein ThiS
MRVRVKVFGHLRRFLPDRAETATLELDAGTTVDGLIRSRSIPDEEVWVVTCNGARVEGAHVLHDGDEVCVFSPVGGG